MRIGKIASTLVRKFSNRIGFYSKKQSVEVATNIGKELINLSRTKTPLSKELVQSVIKKQGKHLKVNVITDENEISKTLAKDGISSQDIENLKQSYAAFYFGTAKGTTGIYAPNLTQEGAISDFAHEFEHYMYDEHTPKRKILISTVRKIVKVADKLKNILKIKESPKKLKQVNTERVIQNDLQSLFGINNIIFAKMPEKYEFNKYLKGENFEGLQSDKRVDAYIRAITRHSINPKNKGSFGTLLMTKTTLDDEIRAYGVSDAVKKYAHNTNAISWEGIVSDIYRRTSEVLKKEMKLSLTAKHKKDEKFITTGLPTSAYKSNFLSSLLSEKSGKVIKISELEHYKPKGKVKD